MNQDAEQELQQLTDRIARVEPRLDELTRERMLARIRAQLAEPPAPRSRWLAYAALAAVALAFAVWLPRDAGVRAPPAQAVVTPARTPAPALVPYLVSGGTAERADRLLAKTQTKISLDEGERVLVSLDDVACLALIGPAVLHVRDARPRRMELELERGTLLGDYEHRDGNVLIIRSPRAEVEIVGTLFAVSAHDARSEVAVARGKVRVREGRRTLDVSAGEGWRAGQSTVEAIDSTIAAELDQHARSLRSSTSSARGFLGISGPHLEARVDGHRLGFTPLWVLLRPGANTVELHDALRPQRPPRTVTSVVRDGEHTELVVEPAREEVRKPRARPAPVAPPVPEPAPEPSAETLYMRAEQAMREGEPARARTLLETMLAKYPDAPNRDLALYDLALSHYKRKDYTAARAALTRLEKLPPRASLRELAARLDCRIVTAWKPVEAPACEAELRSRFPGAP